MRNLLMLAVIGLSLLAAPPIFAQESGAVFAEVYRTVNVRSGPSTLFDVIAQLTPEMVVDVIGRSDSESNWLQVRFNGRSGWVAYFTVTVVGDTNRLPITWNSFPTPPPLTPTPDQFVQLEETVSLPTATAFRRANVRSGPSTDFDRIGVLEVGDSVPITGMVETMQWLRIDFQGQAGWVAFFVVNVSGSLEEVPIVEFATTEGVGAVEIVPRFNLNLRDAPSLSANIIAVIPYQTILRAEARTPNSLWLRVQYNDLSGWILSSPTLFETNMPLDVLPISPATIVPQSPNP
ncbi:MAG: SH3 domain-containing protein [Aggregatilineales bacterium]